MESINPNGTKHHYEQGKIEGSWKGMKRKLEQDLLCESLRGRVSYHFTKYSRYGSSGNCASVSLDGQPLKKFGFMYAYAQLRKTGVLSEGQHVWDIELAERDEYEDWDFMHALNVYRNQPIEMSVASDNPIIRMFAIVDRRVGKRTLARLRDTVHAQPEWLKRLYVARMVADGIGE